MNVDEFLKLLDEPQVQQKIKLLLADSQKVEKLPVEEKKSIDLDLQIELLAKENQNLNQRNIDLDKAVKKFKKENEEMKAFIKKLKEMICGKDKELATQTDELLDQSSKITTLKNNNSILELSVQSKSADVKNSVKEFKELKELFDKTQSKLNWYRENFSEDIKVQEIYSGLSEVTKGSLSGIFKSTTLSGLIACGIQDKNISNLWDYVKNEVVNGNNPDVPAITKLFEILFARFTLALPMYEPQSVAPGDDFDTQLHIKHHSSLNVSGTIESVLLRGYLNTKTGKVTKQSIVKI